MGNRVTLIKRPDKLELEINGIVVKNNFVSQGYDSTTKSEINTVIQGSDGQDRLDGTYNIDGTISFQNGDTNDAFDGTNQIHINFIDLSSGV